MRQISNTLRNIHFELLITNVSFTESRRVSGLKGSNAGLTRMRNSRVSWDLYSDLEITRMQFSEIYHYTKSTVAHKFEVEVREITLRQTAGTLLRPHFLLSRLPSYI